MDACEYTDICTRQGRGQNYTAVPRSLLLARKMSNRTWSTQKARIANQGPVHIEQGTERLLVFACKGLLDASRCAVYYAAYGSPLDDSIDIALIDTGPACFCSPTHVCAEAEERMRVFREVHKVAIACPSLQRTRPV